MQGRLEGSRIAWKSETSTKRGRGHPAALAGIVTQVQLTSSPCIIHSSGLQQQVLCTELHDVWLTQLTAARDLDLLSWRLLMILVRWNAAWPQAGVEGSGCRTGSEDGQGPTAGGSQR